MPKGPPEVVHSPSFDSIYTGPPVHRADEGAGLVGDLDADQRRIAGDLGLHAQSQWQAHVNAGRIGPARSATEEAHREAMAARYREMDRIFGVRGVSGR